VSRRLAAGFRVISLDLRNHGESPRADGMTYRAMADDVLETLAARHALPAAFLGHSMGGKVAMAAALTRAEAVTRLVVGDIAPVAYHHRNAAITEAMHGLALAPGLTRAQADAALAGTVPDPAVWGPLRLRRRGGAGADPGLVSKRARRDHRRCGALAAR
jgi:pimeloyl-ACP methyl ester carboxylesterase